MPPEHLTQKPRGRRIDEPGPVLPGRLSLHPFEHIEDVLVDLLPHPVLAPEVMHDEPADTPAASAICRAVTPSDPRTANNRRASSRMTARAVRSPDD
ncbi:hypothetical protein QFZ63_002915 [Streptomyces sp. B3I7]|nr:hypothetical protein [Streptomyces sp. B3I7]